MSSALATIPLTRRRTRAVRATEPATDHQPPRTYTPTEINTALRKKTRFGIRRHHGLAIYYFQGRWKENPNNPVIFINALLQDERIVEGTPGDSLVRRKVHVIRCTYVGPTDSKGWRWVEYDLQSEDYRVLESLMHQHHNPKILKPYLENQDIYVD